MNVRPAAGRLLIGHLCRPIEGNTSGPGGNTKALMSDIVKVSALLLGSALLMFAGGLQGLLISIRGGEEGFSLLALGLIGTSWSVGYIAGTFVVPGMVSRVGHIRSFSVMAALASMVILFNLLFIEQTSWIVLRAFSGFCFAGAAMIVESWLNEVTTSERRGTVFASYMMANFTFSTAGQMIIAATGVQGYLPFVIGALGFALAVLPTALTVSAQPRPLARAKLDIGLLFRTSPIAVIATLGAGMAGGAFGTLAPVYGIQIGLDSATIAYLMSLSVVISAVGQMPIGRLSDTMDRRIVLVGVSAAAAASGIFLLIFNPGDGWLLWAMFALYGIGANSIYPVAAAHANDFAQDGEYARIASSLILLFGVGLATGPLFASMAMALISPVGLFLVTAMVHGVVAIFAVIRIGLRKPATEEERNPFHMQVDVKGATMQTVVLNPQVEADEVLDEMTEPGDEYIPPERDDVDENDMDNDDITDEVMADKT